ncbi:MAG: class I SAM-dependent methyltransferase, partial [Planctomycetales bacterium]|nr:class I SAM-dependent methyltransferase [Planctomycetales bacterium]
MNVTQVPRSPFLPQSKRLLAHLLRHSETPGTQVLEVGCGEESCLVEHLAACWPDAVLDQIDARPEVIPIAQKRNPRGTVRQLNIADMSGVENNSYDAIVAMSVFDQNPLAAMEPIAKELHRVLRPGGIFAYIHNEEVNAPAASASAASLNPPKCILPNDRWHPNNDFEYCVGR